jgi:HK97 family phage prohead protease
MSTNTHDLRSISGAFDAFSEDDLRAIDEGAGRVPVRGYAARFNELSDDLGGYREIISPGAFDDVLADPNTDVRALINHEGVPLARYKGGRDENTLELSIDDEGLRYSFDLNLSHPESRSLAAAMSRGDIDQSSFRFQARDGSKFSEQEGGLVRDVFRLSSLRDVSVVTFPAYPTTSAEVKRSLEEAQETLETEEPAKPEETKRAAAAAAAEAEADELNATPRL